MNGEDVLICKDILMCFLIPIVYIVTYIAGKYDILNLICEMLEENCKERKERLIMEKYIIGGNSSGKTRKMLEEAKKSNAVVVCNNPSAMNIKANNYGIFGLEIVGYEDNINDKKVAIDEIGDFLKYHFGAELDSFTMTIE
ncbi:MAG: hypothetical protein IKW51_08490 [Bacteroidales bacterium]|nr:hypothetical protein [Bacteroidales bacterium]